MLRNHNHTISKLTEKDHKTKTNYIFTEVLYFSPVVCLHDFFFFCKSCYFLLIMDIALCQAPEPKQKRNIVFEMISGSSVGRIEAKISSGLFIGMINEKRIE